MTGYAAIDLGTNSTNLLIVDPDGQEIERIVAVTRLGAGLGQRASGSPTRLDPEAFERTLAQLRHYRDRLDHHGVDTDAIRIVTTAAARALGAEDRERLFDEVQRCVGSRPILLSGRDEGRLAFAGATAGLSTSVPVAAPPWLVVDIGGGSTELMWGRDHPEQIVSLDIGAVSLTESTLAGDPPRPEELSNAIGLVSDLLADHWRDLPDDPAEATMVGIAGTITTIAAVEIGLTRFEPSVLHGFVLERPAVEDVFRTLATETLTDRRHNPGLAPERADVIVGGLCILVAIMRTLHTPELVVSIHNLLDGVVDTLRRGGDMG